MQGEIVTALISENGQLLEKTTLNGFDVRKTGAIGWGKTPITAKLMAKLPSGLGEIQQKIVDLIFQHGRTPYFCAHEKMYRSNIYDNTSTDILHIASDLVFWDGLFKKIYSNYRVTIGQLHDINSITSPTDFINYFHRSDYVGVVDYYGVCGGSIISPEVVMSRGIDNLGINKVFLSFLRRDLYPRLNTLVDPFNHDFGDPFFMALAVKSSLLKERNVIYISDSDAEDWTSHMFRNSFLVSDDIDNSKTSNTIKVRVGDGEDMLDHLIERVENEYKKEENQQLWKEFILSLTELDQILKSSLRIEVI